MKKRKNGFGIVETVFMVVFLAVALLLVYKSFVSAFQNEKKLNKYDNTAYVYKTYFVKEYLEANEIENILDNEMINSDLLEIDCSLQALTNKEYCEFLMSSTNFDIKKIYVLRSQSQNLNAIIEPTTYDYIKTLKKLSKNSGEYYLIVNFNDGNYANLKMKLTDNDVFALTINPNGGSIDIPLSLILRTGDIIMIPNPVKSGYAFTGWTITGNGSKMEDDKFIMGGEDAILLAKYEPYECSIAGDGDFWCPTSYTLIGNICRKAAIPTVTRTAGNITANGIAQFNANGTWIGTYCDPKPITCSGSPTYVTSSYLYLTEGTTICHWMTACSVAWNCTDSSDTLDYGMCYRPASADYTCSIGELNATDHRCHLMNQSSCPTGWTVENVIEHNYLTPN